MNAVNLELVRRVEDSTYAGLRAVHGISSSSPNPIAGEALLAVIVAVAIPEGCSRWWTVFHQL